MNRRWLAALLAGMALNVSAGVEDTVTVTPDGPELQEVLDEAAPGQTIRLASGDYQGNFRIRTPLVLRGERGAVLDGDGRGHILRVEAPDVTVQGLTLRNGGADLNEHDSAIYVASEGEGAVIADNRIKARGFGIRLHRARDTTVRSNRITGDSTIRSQDRGDGIRLFATEGARVVDNEVRGTRDGIYIDNSNHNRLIGNRLFEQRYGIHYMFSHDNVVQDNFTRDNRMGYALMQSRNLKVVGNEARRDQSYGFLLNYVTYSTVADNRAIDIQRGHSSVGTDGHAIQGTEGKALFVYNAIGNEFRGNLFAGTEIGIHLTAGSRDNTFVKNAFVGNKHQVKYISNELQEWSLDGVGNYWSDYLGWDLRGDGIGDMPYEPNDAMDRILWKYPLASVLANSPAVQLLRWVQRQFPVFRPPGVRDSHPLMTPPHEREALQ